MQVAGMTLLFRLAMVGAATAAATAGAVAAGSVAADDDNGAGTASDAAAAAAASGAAVAAPPLMPGLLLPSYQPTWNLSQSTATQSCFGPARIGKPPAVQPLTNKSGEFMRHWGIVTLDFESQEQLWGHHKGGKDSDTMMLAQATQMKAIAPETKIWVYRNLAQAYSNFVQFREKLEDPAYADWWLPFGPESTRSRCG